MEIITVTKRDGSLADFDYSRIEKQINFASEGLNNIDKNLIATEALKQIKDNSTTKEVQDLLIKTASNLVDVDKPDYTFVASRLFLNDLYHKVGKKLNGVKGKSYSHSFKSYLEYGIKANRIIENLADGYDLDLLESHLRPERDNLFNYLGVLTLHDRYLLKDGNGAFELPQHMFMAISMFLANKDVSLALKLYEALSTHKMMMATPTLSNARTPHHQLSSCFKISVDDNIESIFDSYKEMALLSKFGGGIGCDFSNIRASGSDIRGHKGVGGGIIPFLKIMNDTALAVDQLGCVDRNSFIEVLGSIESDNYTHRLNGDRRGWITEIKSINTITIPIPITEAKVGDLVKSFNMKTGQVEFKEIEETHEVFVAHKDQIKIIYDDGGYITTSKWHPLAVYQNNEYKYIRSDEVKIGDLGINSAGKFIKITGIDLNPMANENYFDLSVKDNNNYFATTGEKANEKHLIHNTRKGSINTFIETWHWDIEDFIDLRRNSGDERRRAHDLFISLWINDLFMERVSKNMEWTLLDPKDTQDLTSLFGEKFKTKYELYENQNIRKKKIPARQLYRKIIISYFETGTPFLVFKDEANRRNQNNHSGIIRSSNLCTEIFENTSPAKYKLIDGFNQKIEEGRTAVCNLASINISKVNQKKDIEEIVSLAIRVLDNVIDLNYYPTLSTKLSNKEMRPIGLGIMGEAEMLATKQIHFGSQEHYELIDEVVENVSYFAIKTSNDLAVEKGSYSLFNGSNWSKGIFPIDTANVKAKKLTNRTLSNDWNSLKESVKKKGMRNSYLMAIAPTSSISILVGTTQAIEPIYKKKWFENNLSGQTPAVAPNLNSETWYFYKSAYEIDQIKLIKAGAIRQKYIDQGQSLNLFIDPKKYNGNDLTGLYLKAWQYGLKSTYYLRSKAPEIVDRDSECLVCQ